MEELKEYWPHALWVVGFGVFFLMKDSVPGGAVGIYAAFALLIAVLALTGFVWSGIAHFHRKRRIATNPLDRSLRALVASDLSWENCAQHPDYAEVILTNFRFLVEEDGFNPARFVAPRQFSFRRGKHGVFVAQRIGGLGPGVDLTVGTVCLYRSEAGMTIEDACMVAVEGHNERGLAFTLRSQLDAIVRGLESGGELPEGVDRIEKD